MYIYICAHVHDHNQCDGTSVPVYISARIQSELIRHSNTHTHTHTRKYTLAHTYTLRMCGLTLFVNCSCYTLLVPCVYVTSPFTYSHISCVMSRSHPLIYELIHSSTFHTFLVARFISRTHSRIHDLIHSFVRHTFLVTLSHVKNSFTH